VTVMIPEKVITLLQVFGCTVIVFLIALGVLFLYLLWKGRKIDMKINW